MISPWQFYHEFEQNLNFDHGLAWSFTLCFHDFFLRGSSFSKFTTRVNLLYIEKDSKLYTC